MLRWTPEPLGRAVIIFIQSATYSSLFAVLMSCFMEVGGRELLATLGLGLAAGTLGASRVGVEISAERIRVANHVFPWSSNIPLTAITKVRLIPQPSSTLPNVLSIHLGKTNRRFPLGWCTTATAEEIAGALRAAVDQVNKRN